MTKSILSGRRIQIAGSIAADWNVASAEEVSLAREFIGKLVAALVKKRATVVVPVDAEKLRDCDSSPICFDWLVWESIRENFRGAKGGGSGYVTAST